MPRLADRIALVTGAAGGIGYATAELFAEEGATVVLTDLDAERGAAAAARLAARGLAARFLPHDVSSEDDWRRVVADVEATHGRLDVLVNNAGVAWLGPVEKETLAGWRRMMAVNLDGVFLGVKAALPLMARGGGGSIVNLSSIEGLVGDPGLAAYNAAKGGVRLFTKSVALDCARSRNGIRVNSVHPGWVDTAMIDATLSVLPADVAEKVKRGMVAGVPLGRAAAPREIACGCLFLASDESSYMTGSELVIDGGYTAQ